MRGVDRRSWNDVGQSDENEKKNKIQKSKWGIWTGARGIMLVSLMQIKNPKLKSKIQNQNEVFGIICRSDEDKK